MTTAGVYPDNRFARRVFDGFGKGVQGVLSFSEGQPQPFQSATSIFFPAQDDEQEAVLSAKPSNTPLQIADAPKGIPGVCSSHGQARRSRGLFP